MFGVKALISSDIVLNFITSIIFFNMSVVCQRPFASTFTKPDSQGQDDYKPIF